MRIISITAIQETFGGVSKIAPQFQIYNDKVYYAWRENYKIYTAISDSDGTNFVTNELISTTNTTRSNPQMQVYNDKIYYFYFEIFVVGTGGWGESIYNHQLFLVITDLDGSNISINQYRVRLENYGYLIKTPQFHVYENTIYYIWSGSGLANLPSPSSFAQPELWFGISNLDGSNFTSKQQTFADSVYDSYYEIFTPQFQVYGNKIYYVYSSYWQLCTASSDLYGDNFSFVNRYEEIEQQYPESYSDNNPQIQIYNNKLYYFWSRYNNDNGLFLAFSNLDGSNFTIKFQTSDYYSISYPQFHVYGNKIYYSWVRYYNNISFTATSNLDGSNFENNLYYPSSTTFDSPQLQVYSGKVYYVWNSKVSNINQIWLGFEDVPTSGYPWPMYQSDMQNTGYSNNAVNELTNPSLIWIRNSNYSQSFSNIVIDVDGTIYYGTSDGKFVAVNYDGSLKWECDLTIEHESIEWVYNEEIDDYEEITVIIYIIPNLSYGCPAIADDGTIYVASTIDDIDLGRLFAVNPDGTIKWRHDINSIHYSGPSAIKIAPDGTIIFTSYYTYATNPNGTLKWRNDQSYTFSDPVIKDNRVYVAGDFSASRGIYPINLITGATELTGWTNNSNTRETQPFIGNSVYASWNYNFYALNPTTGVTEWTYTAGNIIAIGSDNTIYVRYNNELYALNTDGTLKWTYNIGGYISNNIVIDSNDNIFFIAVIDSQSKLFCIDYSGNLVFESVLDQYNLAIGGDGYLYVSNSNTIGKIGNYIPPQPLPQVQCRATQIIVSANSGKIILSVPIL